MRCINPYDAVKSEVKEGDIQCEKFIEDESVSHEPCDSMYPNIC